MKSYLVHVFEFEALMLAEKENIINRNQHRKYYFPQTLLKLNIFHQWHPADKFGKLFKEEDNARRIDYCFSRPCESTQACG